MSLSMTEANTALDRGEKITLPGSDAYWYRDGWALKRANKVTGQVWGMVGAMPWKSNWEIYTPEPEKITYSEALLICANEPGSTMRWYKWSLTTFLKFNQCLKYFDEYHSEGGIGFGFYPDMAIEKGWIVTRPTEGDVK